MLGASVVVKGTTKGTTTDFDGNFTIDVPAKATLSVSFIGYHTQNVAVGNQNQLTIVLKEEQEQLDEVVVVGYGTVRKKDLTGAVTSVSNKALKEKPIANAGEALQGRAAGVQVTSAGKPGDNVSFRIRGISTINNSEPLLVIDGVPTDLGINALNVDDIENIDVLKDASATAIYGSRGANGVVLITTKKRKKWRRQTVVQHQCSPSTSYQLASDAQRPRVCFFSQRNDCQLQPHPWGKSAYTTP